MFHQRRQQRGEILHVQLQERGRLAVRQRFDLFDDGVVLRREGESASLGQGVQRTTAAAPFRFKHQHDFAAREGLVEIRREEDEQFGGLTGRGTLQRSQGRARHSVRAVMWLAKIGAHGVTRPTIA